MRPLVAWSDASLDGVGPWLELQLADATPFELAHAVGPP
jgi:hypothetical protein